MMIELVLRFVIGGVVISAFSLLGDLFKPKSFAGLFAAAPTVALASLGLVMHGHGASYVALEARSMIAGALAFFVYACICSVVLMQGRWKALPVCAVLLPSWGAVATVLWMVWLRRP